MNFTLSKSASSNEQDMKWDSYDRIRERTVNKLYIINHVAVRDPEMFLTQIWSVILLIVFHCKNLVSKQRRDQEQDSIRYKDWQLMSIVIVEICDKEIHSEEESDSW